MSTPVGDLVVRLKFDSSQFERGITATKRELSSYGKAVESSTKFAKEQGYELKASNTALENMRVKYQGLSKAIEQNQSIMQKLEDEGKRGGDEWARRNVEMQDYMRQAYYLNEEYKKMQKESYIANHGLTKLGGAFDTVGQGMQKFGGYLTDIGSSFTQIGTVATAGGALFLKSAMDFERGLVGVQKTTGASSEKMQEFSDGIREIARNSIVGHQELTSLAEMAGQLGIKQDELVGFTETMAKVGTSTNLTAEQAGEAFARFTNITGTGTTTIDNLGSALVHLGKIIARYLRNQIEKLTSNIGGNLNLHLAKL